MKVGTSAGFAALRVSTGVPARARDSLAGGAQAPAPSLAQQINDWQQAQDKALASTRSGASQAALEKAGMLKQRLEMLKAMLLFASPEVAKSIAVQLKSIAGQLAALGKNVGAGTGGAATATTAAAQVPASGAAEAAAAGATVEAVAPADSAAAEEEAGAADAAPEESRSESRTTSPDGSATQDKALRQALQEARALLKVLIERVKAKLRQGDRDARLELDAARKDLANLDQALVAPQTGLYTAQGGAQSSATTLPPSAAGVDLHA